MRIVSLGRSDSLRIEVVLAPTATQLAQVNVVAAALRPMLTEFEERRRMGLGRFMTVEFFERWQGSKLSDILLRRVPGVGITPRGTLVSARGCEPAVWINGLLQTGFGPFNLNSVDPSQILAAEFHSLSTLPMRYSRTGKACGALLLWLRH